MGWLELLRLFAEDQNRASAESNREFIIKITETMSHNNLVFTVGFTVLGGICIALALIDSSHSKRIKKLEDSFKSLSKDVR